MTITEFYERIEGDYKAVLSRLGTERLVAHIALMFLKDDSYSKLVDGFEKKDAEEAFRAAHTLKGVCINLGFDRLYKDAYDLTEALRKRTFDGSYELFEKVKENYQALVMLLSQVQE